MLFFTESKNHYVINLKEIRYLFIVGFSIFIIFIKHAESDIDARERVDYNTEQHALDDLHRIKSLLEKNYE